MIKTFSIITLIINVMIYMKSKSSILFLVFLYKIKFLIVIYYIIITFSLLESKIF